MLRAFLMVGFGGFLGSVARYGVKLLTDKYLPLSFPYGTFIVNIVGCFIIGLLYGMAERHTLSNASWLIAATGFCGAFTTFSTFALENNVMYIDKIPMTSVVYTLLSLVAGILLCRAGIWLAK